MWAGQALSLTRPYWKCSKMWNSSKMRWGIWWNSFRWWLFRVSRLWPQVKVTLKLCNLKCTCRPQTQTSNQQMGTPGCLIKLTNFSQLLLHQKMLSMIMQEETSCQHQDSFTSLKACYLFQFITTVIRLLWFLKINPCKILLLDRKLMESCRKWTTSKTWLDINPTKWSTTWCMTRVRVACLRNSIQLRELI